VVAGEGSGTTEPSWEALRDRAVAGLDALIAVTKETQHALTTYQAALEMYRRHLSQGGRAADMPSMIDIPKIRISFSDGMNELERVRRISRVALWRLQLVEGTSMADIARSWGLSRQLVSRALGASTPESETP
jgi:hypothetical protein